MIGNNELRLNEATVKVAIQEWLAKRMVADPPVVLSVRKEQYEDIFVVQVSGQERATGGVE